MQHTIKHEEKNQVLITVTVPAATFDAQLKHAAEHISEHLDVPGFRKGHAPYDVVKGRVGEQALLEHAAEELIQSNLSEVLMKEDLQTVGSPQFGIEKMAAGNDFIFTARMSLMPRVTKLADYTKMSVEKSSDEPTAEEIAQAKDDLRKMRRQEAKADAGRELVKGDKAVVNMSMKKDGVVIEGGDAQNHGIYTDEGHYIPGFVDAIIGMKEGETRTFSLPFPEDHYQKHLAGANVDFTVELKEIFTLDLPNWDDELAKSLGLDSVSALDETLHKNLKNEKEQNASEKLDREILEMIAKDSSFDEFSDLLVGTEIEKMIQELQSWVEDRGMEWSAYINSIGKSIAEIKLDFTPQAIMRIKVALVLEAIAKAEKIVADEKALDEEIDRIAAGVQGSPETKDYVYSPVFRDRLAMQHRNRDTIAKLRSIMVK